MTTPTEPLAPVGVLTPCEAEGGCEACGAESTERLCDSCVVLGVSLDTERGRCSTCGRRCGGWTCSSCVRRRMRLMADVGPKGA